MKNQTEKLCTPPSNDDDDWTLGKAIECPFQCGSDPHYTTLPGTTGRNRVTTILIITYIHAPKAFGLPCLVSDFRRALRLPIGAVSYKGVVYLCGRRRITTHIDLDVYQYLGIILVPRVAWWKQFQNWVVALQHRNAWERTRKRWFRRLSIAHRYDNIDCRVWLGDQHYVCFRVILFEIMCCVFLMCIDYEKLFSYLGVQGPEQ